MKKDIPKLEDLLNILKGNFLEKELKEVEKAYFFAEEKHREKVRLTNEPYITHPLNVALILSELNVDKITIMSALLHEVINNGDTTEEELQKNFGTEITSIVKSISTINKLELPDSKESSAIYLRKVLVGLAEDVRVLFIKLADRLHNMRTIWAVNPKKQKRKANETMNVLIPIAHRLGIYSIKSELEDLCLRYLKPDVYDDILKHLSASVEELNEVLEEMQESISEILIEHGIKFRIKSRVKSIYSIYKKLSTWRKWSDIYDILALRIIVEKESECYLTIGLIHSKFRPIAKRFKDYIAMPKENMYQSLHTGIIGRNGHVFEVQVRTYEMDEIAEKGIASHFSYKEKGTKKIQSMMEQKLEIFRNMIESYKENENVEDFARSMNTDFLGDLIYVFTPKGDVVELPKGSTPIDFAYRIHSKVGDSTIGAIVNEEIVPLSYELKDNDCVKINTNKNGTPSKEWLEFVKTTGAKNKIKSYFSKQDRMDYIENGKNILEKELRKQKLSFNEVFTEEKLEKVYKDLKINDMEEIYLAIGSFRYTAGYVIKLTTEEKQTLSDALIEKVTKVKSIPKINNKNDIVVGEYNDILVTLAKCCKPVKGDKIIGYITKGEGISVHCANCSNILDKNERLISVLWSEKENGEYYTDIFIETLNDKNYVTDIINKASSKNINVVSLNMNDTTENSLYNLTIKVKNTTELNDFLNSLYSLTFVKKAGKK